MAEVSAALGPGAASPGGPLDTGRRAGRDAVLDADAIALQLRSALDRIVLPLSTAARAFVARKGWAPFGHARLEDHSRERFDRSSRWVRDLASLGEALEKMPGIGEALAGSDGYRPIGRVAALVVARAASPESVYRWIEFARTVTVRELKVAAARSRKSGTSWPPKDEQAADDPPDRDREDAADDRANPSESRRLVRSLVPEPVLAAFDETLALHRAVSGHEVTVTSFVEALVGEGFAGPSPPDADSVPLRRAPGESVVEEMMARVANHWAGLEASVLETPPDEDDALAAAATVLERLEFISRRAGGGDPGSLDEQIRTLIRLEDELERHLGRVLREMGDRGGWSRLMFNGVGHYAEQRLGLARRSLQGRAKLSRALRRFPVLRDAYEDGDVGFEAALLVVRTLGRGPVDEATEFAWVERARECTIKRLRDERRAHGRKRVAEPAPLGAPPPLMDEEWHASLRLEPGMQRGRVFRLGMLAAERRCADVFLRLRLPGDLAVQFLAVVESAKRQLEHEVQRVPWDRSWPDPDALPSVRAARTFSTRCRRVPAWVGLLAMLEDYVRTWDDPEGMPKRAADRIYTRDGYRCSAPCCTSRRHLEDHHLDYRSRGGGNEPSNRTTLCRFHHRLGEHGVLASCRGTAPLGIHWRLGRRDLGSRYRNERIVDEGESRDRAGGRDR